MQNVGNILTYFKSELTFGFNNREVTSWAYLSINHILGINRSDCIIKSSDKLSEGDKKKFIQIVE